MKSDLTKLRKESFLQLAKFGAVGIGNTIVSMVIYYIFLWVDTKLYLLGSIVGTIISILHAFLWGYFCVFPQNDHSKKNFFISMGKCYLSYGGTAVLSNVMLWIEVSFWSLNELYAPAINLIIIIPINYVLNKLWVFHSKRR